MTPEDKLVVAALSPIPGVIAVYHGPGVLVSCWWIVTRSARGYVGAQRAMKKLKLPLECYGWLVGETPPGVKARLVWKRP